MRRALQGGPLKEPVLCCVKKSQRLRKRQRKQAEAEAAAGEYAVGFAATNRNTMPLHTEAIHFDADHEIMWPLADNRRAYYTGGIEEMVSPYM